MNSEKKNYDILEKKIKNLYKELYFLVHEKFNLKIQFVSNQLQKVHLLKDTRRKIARIKTILIKKGYKI